MSKTIKPKQGVVYECYKGFTDIGGDRCRTGQKFIWDGETKVSDIYVLQKASGRGMEMYVRGEEFASYFIPSVEQTETKPKFKVGDTVLISDDLFSFSIFVGGIMHVSNSGSSITSFSSDTL